MNALGKRNALWGICVDGWEEVVLCKRGRILKKDLIRKGLLMMNEG